MGQSEKKPIQVTPSSADDSQSRPSYSSASNKDVEGERFSVAARTYESNSPDEPKRMYASKNAGENRLAVYSEDGTNQIETIGEHVKKMATQAGMLQLDWQASYSELVDNVSVFYAHKVNEIVDPIIRQSARYLNGLSFDIEYKPEEIKENAIRAFEATLSDARTYAKRYTQFKKKLVQEQKIFPELEEENIRETQTKSMGDWVMFFGLMAILVLVESGANTTLLSSVIEGGIVGAFIVATLVSIINVVGIGTGLGFLYAFLLRKVSRNIFYIAMPVWLGCALLLNLEVGRHREKFVLDIEAKEQAAENAGVSDSADSLHQLVVSAEELANVSFNLSSWQFESVLFFILGVVLCCFGFYKGFCFRAPGENLKPMLESIDKIRVKIERNIENIPLEGVKELTTLRGQVGQHFQEFYANQRTAENRMQDMRKRWNQIITVISTEFVNSYNNAHPQQRITSETLKQESKIAEFPATQDDQDALTEAANFIDAYRTEEQSKFFGRIRSASRDITNSQEEYRAAIRVVMTDSNPGHA